MNAQISLPTQALTELCRRRHIRKLSIFGSALREDFRSDSDIDLLYEVEPGYGIGYITLGFIADELSQIFGGREVDLIRESGLNPRIRDSVLAEAEVIYER